MLRITYFHFASLCNKKWSEKKRKNNYSISLWSEMKELEAKQSEKKNDWKRNKVKKRWFRFALKRDEKIESEPKQNEKLLEAEHSEKTLL